MIDEGVKSERGGMGDGPGIDSVGVTSDERMMSEGVGIEISSEAGDDGVSSSEGSVGDVGVSVVNDGPRSIGTRSSGSGSEGVTSDSVRSEGGCT